MGKQIIFEDVRDRLKFLDLMSSALELKRLKLYAYCLMDNHVHLLVRGNIASLSAAAGLLFGAYAQWFNLKHGRCGHLFQNRYHSETVESDAHCAIAVRYIHFNPVKAGVAETCRYRWSSYSEYIERPRFCDTGFVLELLGGREPFVRFHALDAQDRLLDVDDPRSKTKGMPDAVVYEQARTVTGLDDLSSVASYGRQERDEVLRRLKLAGITVRQIERLTGISKSTVHRA